MFALCVQRCPKKARKNNFAAKHRGADSQSNVTYFGRDRVLHNSWGSQSWLQPAISRLFRTTSTRRWAEKPPGKAAATRIGCPTTNAEYQPRGKVSDIGLQPSPEGTPDFSPPAAGTIVRSPRVTQHHTSICVQRETHFKWQGPLAGGVPSGPARKRCQDSTGLVAEPGPEGTP